MADAHHDGGLSRRRGVRGRRLRGGRHRHLAAVVQDGLATVAEVLAGVLDASGVERRDDVPGVAVVALEPHRRDVDVDADVRVRLAVRRMAQRHLVARIGLGGAGRPGHGRDGSSHEGQHHHEDHDRLAPT